MSAATPPTPARELPPPPPTIGDPSPALALCPNCGRDVGPDCEGTCPTCGAHVSSNVTVDAALPSPLPTPDPRDLLGQAFGPYRLLEEVGQGGMGRVWRAWDTRLKRIVALKQVLAQGAASSTQLERFMREARLSARLRHPHVVPVHDVGVVEGQHYFVCDFIEGSTLADRIGKGVSQRQAALWVKYVAEALSYAHDQSVIHRDVKPGNILIDGQDVPYVTDFGLAKEVELGTGSRPSEPALTLSGYIVGTPQYMSPEQASGRPEAIGPSTDQFSLGCVLYELLTQRPPFTGASLRELLNAVAEQDPSPPSRSNPKVHRDVETICLKALEKSPARRYASLAEMAADLGRYLDGEPILARPAGRVEGLSRWIGKNRRVVVPAAIAVVVTLVVGVSALAKRIEDRRAVDADLVLARAVLARGLAEDARDAYGRVLAIDRGNAEAMAGYEDVRRILRERSEAAAEEHRRALAEKATAEELLRKGGLVQDVLARWLPLSETVEGMEAAYYTEGLDRSEVLARNREAWGHVQAFLDATPGDPTSRAAALAFAGWAKRLAGDDDEGAALLAQAQALDTDLPYGYFLEALVKLDMWIMLGRLPSTYFEGGKMRFQPVEEARPEVRALESEVDALLDRAQRARVWGQGMAQDFRAATEAFRALREGRYDEAEAGLSRVVEVPALRVLRGSLLYLRAYVRYYLFRFGDAEEDLRRVLTARPAHPLLFLTLGLARMGEATELQSRGEDAKVAWTSAKEAYDDAIRVHPGCAEAYNGRGGVRNVLGDPEGAIEDLKRATELMPKQASPWFHLGVSYLQMGRPREAVEAFDRSFELMPPNARSYGLRAWAKQKANDSRGALEDYDAAIRLDSSDWKLWFARSVVKTTLRDFEGAIDDLATVVKEAPTHALGWANRGSLKLMLGDAKGALPDLDEAVRLDSGNPDHRFMRAQARGALGDRPGAREDLVEALRLAPADWPAKESAERLREEFSK